MNIMKNNRMSGKDWLYNKWNRYPKKQKRDTFEKLEVPRVIIQYVPHYYTNVVHIVCNYYV